MFGALGALSGSKNPLINPIAAAEKFTPMGMAYKALTKNRKDEQAPGTINRADGTLPTPPRYGRGSQSLSI